MSPRAPHVAFYMHTVYNGGIERVYFNLARLLMAMGLLVDLVLNRQSGSPMMRQLPEGVRVIDLAARRVWDRPIALAQYMRRERPVSILSATHLANEAAIVARRIAGVDTRIVVSEHTSLSSELSLNRSVAARVLMTWAGRLTYSGADRIIAVSDGVGDDVAELLNVQRDRITTIYNPVLT